LHDDGGGNGEKGICERTKPVATASSASSLSGAWNVVELVI
jgi:hypothetical protein